MTITELQALPDSELNRLAAECMGWKYHLGTYQSGAKIACWRGDWHPTTDRKHAYKLLEEVERRGKVKKSRFASILDKLANIDPEEEDGWITLWDVVTASPRNITIAAIAALKGE